MDDDEFNQYEEAQEQFSQRETEGSEHNQQYNMPIGQQQISQQQTMFSSHHNPSNSSINLYNNFQQFQFENVAQKQQFKGQLIKTTSVYDVLNTQVSAEIRHNNSLKQTPLSFNIENSQNYQQNNIPFNQHYQNSGFQSESYSIPNLQNFAKISHQSSDYSLITNLSSNIPPKQSEDYFFQNLNLGNSNSLQLNFDNKGIQNVGQLNDFKKGSKQQIKLQQPKQLFLSYQPETKQKQDEDEFQYVSQVKESIHITATNNIQDISKQFDGYNISAPLKFQNIKQRQESGANKVEQGFGFETGAFKMQQMRNDENIGNNVYILNQNERIFDGIDNFELMVENKVIEERKQSDEFVFQQSISINQELNFHNQQPINNQTIVQSLQLTNAFQQNNPSTDYQIHQNKPQAHPQNLSNQEDQFGDFQESEPQNIATQNYYNQQNQNKSNIVQIKEQYTNSYQAQYYNSKKTQLQAFVDSLPDYSFLLAPSFCV